MGYHQALRLYVLSIANLAVLGCGAQAQMLVLLFDGQLKLYRRLTCTNMTASS